MYHCVQGLCSKLVIQNAARCNVWIPTLLHQNSNFSLLEGEFLLVIDSVVVLWALVRGQIRVKIPSLGSLTFVVFYIIGNFRESLPGFASLIFLGKPLLIEDNLYQAEQENSF